MGVKADPAADDIRVDGRRVKPPSACATSCSTNRKGYVTTRSDPQRRRTVIDLLGGVREYVYPSAGSTTTPKACCCSPTTATSRRGSRTRATASSAPTKRASPACRTRRRSSRLRNGIPLDGHRTLPATVVLVLPRRRRRRCGAAAHDPRRTQPAGAPHVRSGRPSGADAEAHAHRTDHRPAG